jgi:N-acyl-D-aspartate/D-glutamate deacylase
MHDVVIRNGLVVDGTGATVIGRNCNGVVTVEHDEFTGALPGRLVRGPSPQW